MVWWSGFVRKATRDATRPKRLTVSPLVNMRKLKSRRPENSKSELQFWKRLLLSGRKYLDLDILKVICHTEPGEKLNQNL